MIQTRARGSDEGWSHEPANAWDAGTPCGDDPMLFDEPTGAEPISDRDVRLALARTYCNRCPVTARCLDEGIRNRDSGVRGGVLLADGKPVRRATLGRPRSAA